MSDSTGQDQQPSLATKSVRGGAWIYGRNIITSLINLGVMAILARQLTPADFGLVALAQVLTRFLTILAEAGVTEYIISDNREGREERLQAAFWMNLALSALVVLIGISILPLVVGFYTEPDLGWVLALMFARYSMAQITTVPLALLKKSLRYDSLVLLETGVEITSAVISVGMALAGFGVLSLVLPAVLLEPIRAGVAMRLTGWRPRLPLRVHQWRSVFRYSGYVIGSTLVTTIGAEGDTLIIGKTIGSQALGLYNLAWGLANAIPRNLSGPISKVVLPAFSAIAGRQDRMRAAFHQMLRVLSAATFPLLVGLFVIADLFILTIFGPQWAPAILPLRILLIYALRYSVGSPANQIFYAVARPDLSFRLGLIFLPFYLAAVIIGSQYGITGVAIGVTLVRTIFGLIQLGIVGRLAGSNVLALSRQIIPAFLSSVCMGLFVVLVRLLLAPLHLPVIFEMILLIGFGGLAYLALLLLVFRPLVNDMLFIVDAFSPRLGLSVRRLIPTRS